MSTNPKSIYNEFIRANLPVGITYDEVRAQYVTFNGKRFPTYLQAKWYLDYITKFGYVPPGYTANGIHPVGVLDYVRGYYTGVDGRTQNPSDIVTYGTPGLALMTDSDGFQKWNPHNLLTYSEDFSNAAWSKTRATATSNYIAMDGTDATTHTVAQVLPTQAISARYFYEIELKADFLSVAMLRTRNEDNSITETWIDLTSATIGTDTSDGATASALSDGWVLCGIPLDIPSADTTATIVSIYLAETDGVATIATAVEGEGFFVRNARYYRSDQGGMAPVPVGQRIAGSETYVPTTSAPVYLPRDNSYLYDADTDSWVNNGLFLESEARTNLVTYSDLSNGWGPSRATLSYDQGMAPDGTNSAVKLTADSTAVNSHAVNGFTNVPAADSVVTFSVYLKQDTLRYAQLKITDDAANVGGGLTTFEAHFDLQEGTLTGTANYNGTAVGTHAEIESVGNGWYRCSLGLTKYGGSLRTDTGIRLTEFTSVVNNPTFTGTSTEAILIYGAQLEVGSTPSSYIPTNGSTVTRAAQTAVIEPENNPLIVVGPELVTNGTFDSDVGGFSNTSADISVVSGELVVENQSESPSNTTISISFEIGKYYLISGTYRQEGTGGGAARISLFGSTTPNNSTSTPLSASMIVLASGTSATLSLASFGTADTVSYFDNISVKSLSMPTALSIGMKGKMTYADNDSVAEVSTYSWETDANNTIGSIIRTSNDPINWRAAQAESGIFDSVLQSPITFSPGINVPFNIASRHGNTFVNGAVDGTALTANTTPTALPDLTTADFQIGPDFMGHIQELPLYAADVADIGIAEISND